MANKRENYTIWVKKGANTYQPSDNMEIVDKLEAGAYTLRREINYGGGNPYNYYLDKKEITLDELIDIPQEEFEDVISSIKDFCSKEKLFKLWKYIFKRGYLLYGVPGGGKTSIIAKLIDFIINEMQGVVFIIYNDEDLMAYKDILPIYRGIEPERFTMAIFEDIDGLEKQETLLINMLDGLGNTGHMINIATTNYTEKLSPRLLKRPNRFDKKIEIKSPSPAARKFYFEHKIIKEELEKTDIERWVQDTDGFTMAQLSELIKSVFLLGTDYLTAVRETRELCEKNDPVSSQFNKETKSTVGFRNPTVSTTPRFLNS